MTAPTITEIFPITNDADVHAMIGIHNDVWAELTPIHAPQSIEEYRARNTSTQMAIRHFLARDSDRSPVGLLITYEFVDGSNDHLVFVQIEVAQAERRNGVGKRLLAKAHEVAVEGGRTAVGFDTFETVPAGAAFCESIGAAIAIREHMNAVDVAALDIEMLERWRVEGPERAQGYEMLMWVDGYPEKYLEQVAGLWYMAGEDMPMEDLSLNPPIATAESVAERLALMAKVYERLTAIPCHIDTGTLVGFSELIYRPSDPTNLQTTLTMVHRDHRGHALGKWAKAAVILAGLERWPDGERILTENAKSNAAMLGINDAIGFEPKGSLIGYEATTATIGDYLGA